MVTMPIATAWMAVFFSRHSDSCNVISIAQDAQGEAYARPWLEKAHVTFPTLIDRGNVVGKAFGVKYVPVGIVIDADGQLARPVNMVDIGDPTFRSELEKWAATGVRPGSWDEGVESASGEQSTAEEQQSDACLQQAVCYLDDGKPLEALKALQEGVSLDPENWLIRKQGWAIETPEVFYNGEVDYEWQKTPIKSEIDQNDGS